ncbi:unnamed protein product [Linum trigynum]|uniref:CCHC-type domain-containing protein n=1 Tax=Linum trigynum TaxID=586398 RepID=A0AAV2EN62_9ROSI
MRAGLLSRNIATVEAALPELTREERQIQTQATVDTHFHDANAAFAATAARRYTPPSAAGGSSSSGGARPALASRPQFVSPPSGDIRCHYCQEPGHIQPHCRTRNLYTYCKRTGHIILDCPRLKNLHPRTNGATGYHGSSGPSFAVQPTHVAAASVVPTRLSPESLDTLLQQAL